MCLAIPGEILTISGEDLERSGKVRFGGIIKEISLAYLPEAEIGDFAIVHAGIGIALVDTLEAEQTLRDLQEISKNYEIY